MSSKDNQSLANNMSNKMIGLVTRKASSQTCQSPVTSPSSPVNNHINSSVAQQLLNSSSNLSNSSSSPVLQSSTSFSSSPKITGIPCVAAASRYTAPVHIDVGGMIYTSSLETLTRSVDDHHDDHLTICMSRLHCNSLLSRCVQNGTIKWSLRKVVA